MTNEQVLEKVKNDKNRGSTYSLFKGNKPPGKNQEKLLDKHKIPVDVDPEIRNIIIELNENGIKTLGSCAGHSPGFWKGFVTIGDTVDNTDIIKLTEIFNDNGINLIRFDTSKWVDWFSVEFISVGKDLRNIK